MRPTFPSATYHSPAGQSLFGLSLTELLLFLLFATYGPSFNFAGQFRYAEVVLLIWGALRFQVLSRYMDRLDYWMIGLFALSIAMHYISGLVNNAPSSAVFARMGSYGILAAMFPAMILLSRYQPRRILIIVFGYSAAYAFMLFFPPSWAEKYYLLPWRLGLGLASTVALAAFFAWQPRFLRMAPFALVLMAGVHLVAGGRAIAAVALLAAALVAFGQVTQSRMPVRFDLLRVAVGLAVIVAGSWIGTSLMLVVAEAGLLPDDLALKIIAQVSHSKGLIASARPDTWAAMYAVSQRPLIGYGSGVFDEDVFAYYSQITAELFASGGNFGDVLDSQLQREWTLGIPSHSHIFSAWAEAGVLAALCWLYVFGLAIYVFVRSSKFYNPFAPLFLIIAIQTLWDMLFSPGPHRMDVAIRILVLLFAVRYLHSFDQVRQQAAFFWRSSARRFDGAAG
jgi:O-antigen ligase